MSFNCLDRVLYHVIYFIQKFSWQSLINTSIIIIFLMLNTFKYFVLPQKYFKTIVIGVKKELHLKLKIQLMKAL